MEVLLALCPILSIFVFLFIWKQTSLRSSVLAYVVTLAIVCFYPSFSLQVGSIAHATVKGALICFIVGYVLFFGILLFHLMNKMGSIASIASFVSHATSDRLLQTLLLCFGLCPLIESASGFGIGFMVAAPIFLALGYPPLQAALLSFIGLLASSWGALATGTIIGSQLIEMPLAKMGAGTAVLSTPIFAYFMIAALYIVGGWGAVKQKRKEGVVFFLLFSASIFLFSKYVSVELAGVLASILTTACGLAIVKKAVKQEAYSQHAAALGERESIFKILSPYLFLTVCILISRLMPSLQDVFQSYAVLDLPSYSYKLALLYSPGFWLAITCIFTIVLFRIPVSIIKESFHQTIKQWIPFAITTTMFIAVSEIMGAAGMHQLLARFAGEAFGSWFIIVAPFIGAIGGFLTGSNAGSNAMFMKLQMQTAQHIGLPWEAITMSQNASSSVSTIACPSRITLGAYLCKIPFRENELLQKTTLLVLGAVLLVVIETGIWSFFW
ncbi:L-lactate permease [Ectobacillus panaciterrae]|uniref:L-lactate permease n=1 Tax=Ectobacillus panaciterrae TaxID=363872 RepID=UPI0004135528|nr:L-lactate permease [Ectobacillus panaciterrae]